MKIVVLGGSFNPPTKAHKALMEYAIKSINADLGIYLPADISYLERSRKDVQPNEILPNELRKEMLLAMSKDLNVIVEEYEFGTKNSSRTYESLKHIQSKYPDAEIYFITGSDKLPVIARWYSADKFLSEFKFLVVARKTDNIQEIVSKNEKLKKYKNTFVQYSIPEEFLKISSTTARKISRTKNISEFNEILDPTVVNLYRKFLNI